MTPTRLAKDLDSLIENRIYAFKNGISTNHWPHEYHCLIIIAHIIYLTIVYILPNLFATDSWSRSRRNHAAQRTSRIDYWEKIYWFFV